MRSLTRSGAAVAVPLLLLGILSAVPVTRGQESVAKTVDAIIARLPVGTPADKDAVVADLLKLGEAGVTELCSRIRGSEEPLDGAACAALHGLVRAAGAPGAEETRRLVAGVFCGVLRSDATLAAKSHLITELRTLGRNESVAPVGALLTEKSLCEPAAQTLVSIGTPEAAAALREALPKVSGAGRVTVLFALGRLRDRAAVPALLPEAGSADAAVRHAALFALAEIGDPAADAVLRKAAAATDDGDCERARHGLLRYAVRLAENGHKPEAVAVCRSLLDQAAADETAIGPGAFYELTKLLSPAEAVPAVTGALGHPDVRVRTAALRAAAELPGSKATEQLAEALVALPPDYRAPLFELLRRRGDPAALRPVVQALKDPDAAARIAAIAAVGELGKRDVAPQLIAFLDKTPEEAGAARTALTVMGDGELNATLAGALAGANPATRCGLLAVLAARDADGHKDVFLAHASDASPEVRRTALKILGSMDDERIVTELMALLAGTAGAEDRRVVEQAFLGASRALSTPSHAAVAPRLVDGYGAAAAPVKCALIAGLKALQEGYPAGLAYVRQARGDASAEVSGAALRALADWPTPEPMDDLLKVAAETDDLVVHVLALRGAIRMAGQRAAGGAAGQAAAVAALKSAMAAARRPEEKREVLALLPSVDPGGAVEIAARCLGDADLRSEARAAILKTAARAADSSIEVFVAYDKRATALPAWLEDWAEIGTELETSDTSFKVYAKTFRQGVVSLGGNRAPGTSSHYIVALRGGAAGSPAATAALKQAAAVIEDAELRKEVDALLVRSGQADTGGGVFRVAKVASGAKCPVVPKGLAAGAKVYADRDYTFKTVPAELAGADYVMMANNDKGRADGEYMLIDRGGVAGDEPDEPAAAAAEPAPGPPVRVVLNGELVTEYHYADADRPYFYPVIAPTGVNITRHWPMNDTGADEERDHPHHRSLWFTHGDVNGHDFWTEGKGPKIVQTALKVDSGTDRCVIRTENEWRAKDGTVVCTDVRKHTVRLAGENRIIDFDITLKASHGDVVFGDTKEGSMAMRVAPTLRTKGKVAQGSMVNSEGGSGPGIWGKAARWCDYYGPIDGKVVGMAILDHPDNPRHPTTWHARDYGLCAANPFGLSYFEGKPKGAGNLEIPNGESVRFRYRVVVHNGSAADAGVEKLFNDYAAPPALGSIFNGTDLSGWKVPKGSTEWQVRDGMIAAKNAPERKGSILWTEKEYGDFVIELEFRYGEGTVDSGIFLRAENQQVQLGISGSLKRDMTGSVYVPGKGYPKEAAGVKELLKPRDWNSMRVDVVGGTYTVRLNGTHVLTFEADRAPARGPIGLQMHPGNVMAVDFRNIRVAETD